MVCKMRLECVQDESTVQKDKLVVYLKHALYGMLERWLFIRFVFY